MSTTKLPYLAWHADAEARMKRGEIQKYCRIHGKWHWQDEESESCSMVRPGVCIACEKRRPERDGMVCPKCLGVPT